ncbi:MAG: DUF2156 domain-containing protein [Clostridiales bacterium]|nr:DUF2156 domain-containing protein [Clostridiales bacterium]
MNFEKIQLSDREFIERVLNSDSIYWEFSFSCIYVWNYDRTYVAKNDKYALIYFDLGNKYLFLPPYLVDETYLKEAVNVAYNHSYKNNVEFVMRGLTFEQTKLLDGFIAKSNQNDSDYIYSVNELAELKGKKFHSKRNFVNRFTSKNNYSFRQYEKNDYEKAVALCEKWLNNKESNATLEFTAIKKSLELCDVLHLKIGVLFIRETLVGLSISDITPNGVAHTLFEKGDIDYEGVYQAINYLTAKELLVGCNLVNRQEDMGIEGLRKAKLSYNPIKLAEKYYITKC